MAIGKVNAYATVEAPKADFGAVAQMNIDNLVKSVKEDEQAKAAQKVAADKAKNERDKDLGLFPETTATGTVPTDTFYIKKAGEDRDLYLAYKRDWTENGNYESRSKAEAIMGFYKDQNNQLAKRGEIVTKFNAAAGKGEINKVFSDRLTRITQNKNNIWSQDENGVTNIGIYEDKGDGTMERKEVMKDSNYMSMLNSPVSNIDIPKVMGDEAKTFEKTLNETSSSYTLKKGVKKLSNEALSAIDAMAKGKMEDSDFIFNYMISKGKVPDDNAYLKIFSPELKKELAVMYAEEIKGRIGAETTIQRTAAQQPSGGDGGGTKPTGTVTISNQDRFKVVGGEGATPVVVGYSRINKDQAKEVRISTGATGFNVYTEGLKNIGEIKGTNDSAPKAFYISQGQLILHSQGLTKTSEDGYSYSESGENYLINYNTNNSDFAAAVRGIVNKKPTWELEKKDGTVEMVKIRSAKDIADYYNRQDIENGNKGLYYKAKTTSTGGSTNGAKLTSKSLGI